MRARLWSRLAQVPVASLDQSLAHGPRLRRHLLLAPRRPGHAARGDDGRARHGGEAGQGAVRRDLVLLGPAHRRGGADPPRLGTPLLIHQPSYSLLNRWIEEELLDVLGDEGVGASCSRRSPRGCSRPSTSTGSPRTRARRRERLALARPPHRRGAHPRPGAERDRAGPRAVAGADGARVDAARPARHVDADRREQHPPARGERRRARAARCSPTTSSPTIDRHAVEAGINLWAPSSAH